MSIFMEVVSISPYAEDFWEDLQLHYSVFLLYKGLNIESREEYFYWERKWHKKKRITKNKICKQDHNNFLYMQSNLCFSFFIFSSDVNMYLSDVDMYLSEIKVSYLLYLISLCSNQTNDQQVHKTLQLNFYFFQWALDLLGVISKNHMPNEGHANSLNENLQLWTQCPVTSILLNLTSKCFSTM